MKKYKFTLWLVLGFFLSGCAQMTYKQKAALTGAAACGVVGASAGGIIAHNSRDHRISEGQGVPIGALVGAVTCGTLAYLLAEEPKPPAPPPPPPPPPPDGGGTGGGGG